MKKMSRTLAELMSLHGKKALVTGGAGHVGPVVAQTLLEMGAEVTLTDRDASKVHAVAQRLGLDDNHWVALDLTYEPDMAAAIRVPADRMRGLDLVIHCAALTGTGPGIRQGWAVPFEFQSIEAFRCSLDLNLTCPFIMAQEFKEEKLDGSQGVMVLFGSIYGLVAPSLGLYEGIEGVPQPPTGYSAAKGGVVQLTRHLASVLAPNIRVNSLVPGGLERGQPGEFIDRYSRMTLLGRMGQESDMVGPLLFLVSDLSSYMTGQTLVIDGGYTAV
jgi:NAD(P)-dependent dehydrogenase (short-subunit alcohol dehydrogenase family)